jgi:hypothetical protein
MVLFVLAPPFADSGLSGFTAAGSVGFAVVAAMAAGLTYLGIGSIVLWAFRFAWVQLGALGTLMSRLAAADAHRRRDRGRKRGCGRTTQRTQDDLASTYSLQTSDHRRISELVADGAQ